MTLKSAPEGRQRGAAASGEAPRPTAAIVLTILEAARAIARLSVARDDDLWQGSIDRVVETLRRAAELGSLRVRHPETLLPEVFADWPQPSSGGLVCTVEDVNSWLKAEGLPYSIGEPHATPPSAVAQDLTREQREERRHKRFLELGGEVVRKHDGEVRCKGVLGAVKRLAEEEAAAGRVRSHPSDVAKEVKAHAARLRTRRAITKP